MSGVEQKRRQKDRLLDTTRVPQDTSLQDLQLPAGGLVAESHVGEHVSGGRECQREAFPTVTLGSSQAQRRGCLWIFWLN